MSEPVARRHAPAPHRPFVTSETFAQVFSSVTVTVFRRLRLTRGRSGSPWGCNYGGWCHCCHCLSTVTHAVKEGARGRRATMETHCLPMWRKENSWWTKGCLRFQQRTTEFQLCVFSLFCIRIKKECQIILSAFKDVNHVKCLGWTGFVCVTTHTQSGGGGVY